MQIRWILLFLNVLLQCCFWKPVTAYGNLRVAFQWKQLDYEWSSNETKQLFPGYKQEDNLPLGLEVTNNRIFVTVPRWRLGVVASLNYFYINDTRESPTLIPYPSWEAHQYKAGSVPEIISTFRIRADRCERLWVLDTGFTDILDSPEQQAPPSLIIYDLRNDRMMRMFVIPEDQRTADSLFANIAVEDYSCEDTYVYLGDLGGPGLVVYSWKMEKSWLVKHPSFHPDPQIPRSETEWKVIANGFNDEWNFPNCLGAVDGEHVAIKKPSNTGSLYYNYKKFFSIVLMAVVNSNYEFIFDEFINLVLGNTAFGKALSGNLLKIPEPATLPNSGNKLPFVFLGDDAFALTNNLMKPYSQTGLTLEERIFNYRLSRTRRVVENAFGILVTRFGVFQRPIALHPEKASKIFLACCYLHNYLSRNRAQAYISRGSVDTEDLESGHIREGTWRTSDQSTALQTSYSRNSLIMRARFHGKRILYSKNGINKLKACSVLGRG